jgi:hypothetical protein
MALTLGIWATPLSVRCTASMNTALLCGILQCQFGQRRPTTPQGISQKGLSRPLHPSFKQLRHRFRFLQMALYPPKLLGKTNLQIQKHIHRLYLERKEFSRGPHLSHAVRPVKSTGGEFKSSTGPLLLRTLLSQRSSTPKASFCMFNNPKYRLLAD